MIGSTLAHYEITGLLGRGGMGEVYRARDMRLDRDVAIKILPASMANDPDWLERFHREAKTIASLNHPRIVHVYSVERAGDVHFLTMELVEGEELASRLTGDPPTVSRVLEIGISIVDALVEAHAKGVVHRDLKPANVMLTREGRVKVLDFGLAKLSESQPRDSDGGVDDATRAMGLTQRGEVLGTVPYMSPEQLRGRTVDARSDLFSFGVLLHELATGQRPFTGDTNADVTSSILKDEPTDVRQLRPDLPPRLSEVLGRCLQKEADERYPDAQSLGHDLRDLQDAITSGSSDALAMADHARHRGGRRRLLWIGALVAVGLGVGGVAWWKSSQREGAISEGTARPIVAVLPFDNLGSEEDAYFAAGVTDEITSRLALIDGLGVISRTSARAYAGTEKSIREVGRELGSDFVLEGSIRWDKTREPGRVRISPRLIRVADDTNLWLDNYEREVTEIFEVQSAIASRIAEALDITLMAPVRQALDERPTGNIDAYQAYLQGMKQLYAPGFSETSFALGVRMFERATQLDPEFALAHARLSSMHSRTYHYGYDRTPQRRHLARAAAERALALDDDLADAHIAMAHYFYWCTHEYPRAITELELARSLEPNNREIGLTMAYVKRRQGDFQAAIELLEKDRALSPRDPNGFITLGESYGAVRRYAEAESNFRRAIALAPDDSYPYTELALLFLRWRGDADAAREVLLGMPGVTNNETTRVRFLVETLARRYDAALDALEDASGEVIEAGGFFSPVDLYAAEIHSLQGRTAEASAAFARARDLLEEELVESPDDQRLHAALGTVYAGLGLEEDAREHALRAVALAPLESDALSAPIQVIELARTLTMLGDLDAALERLDIVLSIPSTMSTAWLESDPRWDPLREDPGYEALLEKYRASGSR